MAMIKKKAKRTGKAGKSKAKAKRSAKGSAATRTKKQVDPSEVRKDIAQIVGSEAKNMTWAVVDEALKGQVAPTKFLFEVAGVYPPVTDGEQATHEEDCLAKTLLERLDIRKRPAQEEDEEPAATADVEEQEKSSEGAVDKAEGEKTGSDAVVRE